MGSENIWIAASDGDMTRVKELLDQDKTAVNAKDENGYTPMHAAASWKHPKLLKYLIDNGGDVNILDTTGDTPLHICEDKECAQLLLDHGADPAIENEEGMSAVYTTLENEALEVTELICNKLDIPVPSLKEIPQQQQDGHTLSESKLEDLSNWIMQQVEDKDVADEDGLREMVTKYVMQNLKLSAGIQGAEGNNNADDTVAATIATSTDGGVSQDLDSPKPDKK